MSRLKMAAFMGGVAAIAMVLALFLAVFFIHAMSLLVPLLGGRPPLIQIGPFDRDFFATVASLILFMGGLSALVGFLIGGKS